MVDTQQVKGKTQPYIQALNKLKFDSKKQPTHKVR
jgi:hypothetical protein